MSLSPDAIDAYVRDVAQDRQQAAAHARLLALARQAQPPSRTRLSATAHTAISHLTLFGLLATVGRK